MGVIAIVGSVTSVLSFIGVIFCSISYEWKRSSQLASQNNLRNLYLSEGLWMRCNIPIAGVLTCDNYSTTLFDVPGYLQALRALTIISALLLFCSATCNILALDCVNCIHPKTQRLMAIFGGGASALGGTLILAAVSWYASEIIREFRYDITYEGVKYTFGAALYVGWISGGLALICGSIVLCCSCFVRTDDNDDGQAYTYKPPKSRANEEYI